MHLSFGDAIRKRKAYISRATSISSLFRVLPQTAVSDAPRTTSRTYLPTYGPGNDYLRRIEKGAVVHRLGGAFVKCLPSRVAVQSAQPAVATYKWVIEG
jgi:hypothetical protein